MLINLQEYLDGLLPKEKKKPNEIEIKLGYIRYYNDCWYTPSIISFLSFNISRGHESIDPKSPHLLRGVYNKLNSNIQVFNSKVCEH